jgi:hypothetical protein
MQFALKQLISPIQSCRAVAGMQPYFWRYKSLEDIMPPGGVPEKALRGARL